MGPPPPPNNNHSFLYFWGGIFRVKSLLRSRRKEIGALGVSPPHWPSQPWARENPKVSPSPIPSLRPGDGQRAAGPREHPNVEEYISFSRFHLHGQELSPRPRPSRSVGGAGQLGGGCWCCVAWHRQPPPGYLLPCSRLTPSCRDVVFRVWMRGPRGLACAGRSFVSCLSPGACRRPAKAPRPAAPSGTCCSCGKSTSFGPPPEAGRRREGEWEGSLPRAEGWCGSGFCLLFTGR